MSPYPSPARDTTCISCDAPLGNLVEFGYLCSACETDADSDLVAQADGGALSSNPGGSSQLGAVIDQDRETTHTVDSPLLPADSDIEPVVSFVFPTMNEEDGIGIAMDWAIEALKKLGLTGEIIVSDSSTDQTPEIAARRGAIVVEPNRLGYGFAYRYGFQFARGDYIVMGDPDCTYDFTELPRLLDRIENSDADIVMGSRFEGKIEPGAMPPLHKYIGNPLLTRFLNTFYGAGVTDAHSGFRILTREAYERLDLRSDGMEFASEMIMAATEEGLIIEEVPIRYRERRGEETLDSFHDGWRHVKFMLSHAPGYLFALPGAVLSGIGIVLMSLTILSIQPGPITFGTHTMILGSLFVIVGFNIWELAMFSSVGANPIRASNDPLTRFVTSRFRVEHGISIGVAILGGGTLYGLYLVSSWISSGFSEIPLAPMDMIAFTAVVIGIQMIFSSFHLSAISD